MLGHMDISKAHKLGDNNTRNYEYAFFSTFDRDIIAPMLLRDYFIYNYFSSFIANNTCRTVTKQGLATFECNSDVLSYGNLTNITFVLNDEGYTINASDLFFTNTEKQLEFIIKFWSNPNVWVLGQRFLKNWDVVFDMNSKQLYFYGANRTNFSSFLWIWILIGCLVGVGIILVSVIACTCFKKRQMRKDRLRHIDGLRHVDHSPLVHN